MITKEEIEKLASLARIELSSEEKENLQKDIGAILDYVGQIKTLSPQSARPQNYAECKQNDAEDKGAGYASNIMREDGKPHESDIYTEKLLSAAPQREGEYVRVKKVL